MIPKTYKSCLSDVSTYDVPVNVEDVRTIDEEVVIKGNKEEEVEVVDSEKEEGEQENKVLVSETMFVCVDDISAGTLCGPQTKTLKLHAFTMLPN